jgi:hypothetical protein
VTRFADLPTSERVGVVEAVLADHPEPGAPAFTRETRIAMTTVKRALVDDSMSDEEFEDVLGEWRAYRATLSEHDADAATHELKRFAQILDGMRDPPAEEDGPAT